MGPPEEEFRSVSNVDQDANDFLASGDEDDVAAVEGAAAATSEEKRLVQRAVFKNWLTSDAGREALKAKNRGGNAKSQDDIDEEQSIHSLLAQQQRGSQIIKNPREYQLELFERAKQQNTIAVLDTGSGKTLIAVLLLRWVIDNEIERRANKYAHKISFFLVSSVTLVYQQYSVLDCNLDHNIARLCGADNTHRWTHAKWIQELHENKVIVCTAEILFQALCRSYITMQQINLLIFDEAHHTKKNHNYARIIKDFYLEEEPVARPRVFGMTASPIDAKVDVVAAISELEILLDSKIATTTDMSLTEAIKKPQEQVLTYPALPHAGFETELLQAIKSRYEHIAVFSKVFERAHDIARHLGSWCADVFLLHAFSHEKSKKYELEVENKFHARNVGRKVSELDAAVEEVRGAIGFVQTHKFLLEDRITHTDVSSKVLKLNEYLRMQFERPSNHRCIVFVNRRYIARMLHRLFQKIGTGHMKSGFLVGAGGEGLDEDSFTFRQQVMTLLEFRKGGLNCLFATSVAEEGLDVPDCNLIVRFDMYTTMIQYVQSRGRARNQNSKFIHMVECGNLIHSQTLNEVRTAEANMRAYCDRLPEDRKLQGNRDSLEVLLDKEQNLETMIDPVSGSKLTYGNALSILATFVSAVPTTSEEPQHPTYIVSSRGQKFIAEVVLPGSSPLRSKLGKIHARKALARRSAAFEACKYLRKHNYIDERLAPIYQKKLPAMRNALLAVDMKRRNGYDMRIKPSTWAEQRGTLPSDLWLTIVDFPCGLDRPHQPLLFLTKTKMPSFPNFPVYLKDGNSTQVSSCAVEKPMKITDDVLAKLSSFTFRIFRDVFSKTYEEDASKLSYWIAPAASHRPGQVLPSTVIDWDTLNTVFENGDFNWKPGMPNSHLENRFMVDTFDGSRKFFSQMVDESLHQDDPVPEDGINGAKVKRAASILEYSVSLWKKSRGRATWADDQPVIRAELVSQRRNLLAPPEHKELIEETKAYICPQPLRISAISSEVAASCFVWPAIIHRFESYLISIEGCAVIDLDCEPEFALAAFTKDSDNQDEHVDAERINFQRGMGDNYERLEFIGDTFLKTATTISTFIQNPNENEFEFHVRRMQMLCNKNLFTTAVKLKLYEYIRSLSFNRRYWYPEGLKLLVGTGVIKGQERVMYHDPRKHNLGEKTIADVCEALIGASFLSHDKPDSWDASHWTNAVKAVTTLVDSDDHRMTTWNDYRTTYVKPAYQIAPATAVQHDLAAKVELKHPYKFKYPRLLYSAFMHPSVPYIYEKVPNYQRLEFLGDALLDQASITYLFHKYPTKDPQWLTEHKMAMVSNRFLGALCVAIGFHKHLRHHHAALQSQIQTYATDLLEAKRTAGGCKDFWTTVSDPPKCLADIVEAYIGAIFIDSDFDYSVVQDFFDQHVHWYFEDMTIYDAFAQNHPCTFLHNLLQTTFGCNDYRLMATVIPGEDGGVETKDVVAVVIVHNRVVASSVGKNGRCAKSRAAVKASEEMEGLAPFEFRARFGCDCKGDGMEGDGEGGLDGVCAV